MSVVSIGCRNRVALHKFVNNGAGGRLRSFYKRMRAAPNQFSAERECKSKPSLTVVQAKRTNVCLLLARLGICVNPEGTTANGNGIRCRPFGALWGFVGRSSQVETWGYLLSSPSALAHSRSNKRNKNRTNKTTTLHIKIDDFAQVGSGLSGLRIGSG